MAAYMTVATLDEEQNIKTNAHQKQNNNYNGRKEKELEKIII